MPWLLLCWPSCLSPSQQDIARTIAFRMLSLFRAHCSSVAPRTVTRGLQTSARLAYPKGPNASNLDEEKQNEATTQDQDKKTMPGMSSDVRFAFLRTSLRPPKSRMLISVSLMR